MGISFQNSQSYPLSTNDLFHYSISALRTIQGISVENQDINLGEIIASKGTSLLTWGHRIEIQIMPNGSTNSTVSVSSRLKTQLIDYGTNKKIVGDFFTALNFIIQRTAENRIRQKSDSNQITINGNVSESNIIIGNENKISDTQKK